MAEVYWPPDLPQSPMVGGGKYGTANNTVRFKTEYGPPKVRRRTSANLSRRTLSFYLERNLVRDDDVNIDQVQIFLDFMEMIEGFSFWFPDPMNTKQYIKVRFVSASEESGQELTPYSGDQWTVTVNAEVWPYAVRVRP